jgi:hypothetical protein
MLGIASRFCCSQLAGDSSPLSLSPINENRLVNPSAVLSPDRQEVIKIKIGLRLNLLEKLGEEPETDLQRLIPIHLPSR